MCMFFSKQSLRVATHGKPTIFAPVPTKHCRQTVEGFSITLHEEVATFNCVFMYAVFYFEVIADLCFKV